MLRDRALGITIIVLLLTSLACNAFVGKLEPFPPAPTSIVEIETGGERLPPAAANAVPALSPVESPRLTLLVDLNVRSGPGVQYERVGFILKDESVAVLGVDPATGWWKIACPDLAVATGCWVSGNEQYTQAEYVEDIAELEAPPTPTPVPPELAEGQGVLAFIDGGRLFAAALDLAQFPPRLAADPVQMSAVENVQRLSLSPDGRRIAFISETPENDRLFVINIDGQDQRELLLSSELPLDAAHDDAGFIVWIDQLSWFHDSRTLAFNTTLTNRSTPVVISQEDLWTVTMDGELAQQFAPGTGGGAFTLMPNDKALLSHSDYIARDGMGQTDEEILVQFEPVNTASEYVYYPVPQPIGEVDAYAYIPAPDPWQSGALTALWQLSAVGPARQLGVVEGATLFDPLVWSPDGARLAFVQHPQALDSPQMARLMIADARGINANPYGGGSSLQFHGWSPDSTRFLYSDIGYYAVGGINAPPMQTILDSNQQLGAARWISNDAFIIGVGSAEDGSWELISTADSGENSSLTTIHGFEPKFDLWLP